MRYLLLIILLYFSANIFGQVPRTVLMEYATNASCPPCADYNPDSYTYLKNNYNQVVSIWYHAWWPGSSDPMYLANIEENRNRIEYYGVNSVPSYMVDGVFVDNPGEYSQLPENVESRLQISSPVDLRISTRIDNDSINISIDLIAYVDVSEPSLVLRTAIIEQMLEYQLPPGSNGESEFPHVFRKFIGGKEGIEIPNLRAGDSLNFRLNKEMLPDWNMGKVAVVTFIQSDNTKEVIQAASDLQFHEISTDAPSFEFISKTETITHEYHITNNQDDTLSLDISLKEISNKEEWQNNLIYKNVKYKSFDVILEPNENINFTLEIISSHNPGYIRDEITAVNNSGESNFTSTLSFLGLTVAGDIVLIDDDGVADYEKNFIRALERLNKDFTIIEYEILDEVRNKIDFSSHFKVILWNLGEHAPSLESIDITLLMSFLNDGGRAFISGSDLGHDIHDVQNLSTGKFFFRNYLDAEYLTDSVTSTSLTSVEGNPLFESEISMQIDPIFETLPDGVSSLRGQSYLTLIYQDTLHYGMLTRELNDYKTAYLTCGLEQIASTEDQDLIIEKVLDWFAKPVVSVEESVIESIPTAFEIDQNYPNPFNPTTSIRFALPKSSFVKLTIYNGLGQKVSELIDEELSPGYHSVQFKAGNLSSGIYFYRISAGSYVETKKMMLLK